MLVPTLELLWRTPPELALFGGPQSLISERVGHNVVRCSVVELTVDLLLVMQHKYLRALLPRVDTFVVLPAAMSSEINSRPTSLRLGPVDSGQHNRARVPPSSDSEEDDGR